MRALRLVLWGLVVAFAAAAIMLYLAGRRDEPGSRQTISGSTFGGPFTLVGADGQPFSSSRLAGKPHAIFFGFTNCPDVCPTTLARLVRLRQQLDGKGPLEIVFVSVDPERDSPAEVGRYTELFGAPVIGLTGSPAQIAQVKRQYGIFSEKVPDKSGSGYTVDHSASVLLFDRNGDFVATISPEEPDSAALAKLQRLV